MAKFNYEVNIQGCDNGYIVRVGCKTLIFPDSDVGVMINDIEKYISGGIKAEIELDKKYKLNMHSGDENMKMKDECCCAERPVPLGRY